MNSLKRAIPWVVAFGLITGCAPIDGLGSNEDEMAKTTTIEVTTAPQETTAPQTTAPATTKPETEVPTVVAIWIKVDADALNVREEASLTARRLAKVYDGMIYEVLDITEDEQDNTWYKIKATEDVTGWVSGDYAIPGGSYEDLKED